MRVTLGPQMRSGGAKAWQRLYSKRGLRYGGSGDISFLEPHLRPDTLALDAGCGDGKSTERLARLCEVVGADFSREALLSLRSQRDVEMRVNLVECNILSLPFCSEKFDAVVCVHTLSHMLEEERVGAAHELSRALRTGGHIMLEGFGRGDIRYGQGEEVEYSTYLRGDGIITHYFQEGELPGLFPGLELLTELGVTRHVSFGARSGRRDLFRVLMRKP